MNPIALIDFYKVGHVSQYPDDTTQVWSNWTPRSSRVPSVTEVQHVGLQYLIKKYLIMEFNENFFSQPRELMIRDYKRLIHATLGVENPKTDHIERLHEIGYLPLKIYSIPEGSSTPLNCPSMVITNTLPEAYWLPNYLETLLSNILWMPSTSATTAKRYRRLFEDYARQAGETDHSFIDWQGHDFSFRGMSGIEAAILSGIGHLTCFSGTDTIPAILAAREYYGAALTCGGSVPATEHSVMCAGTKDGEFETFRRLIQDIYPTGVVSIVSDTWDLWKVLNEYIPALKDVILARNGKVVIRPDSGDPVKIICGDKASSDLSVRAGVIALLAEKLGTRNGLINNAAAIYGDSITVERADAILHKIVHEQHLSPFNCVFGIGSYTYQYVTRDTFNFAMKATAVRRSGKVVPIFKDPVTDNANKKSHCGIVAVYQPDEKATQWPSHYVVENCRPEDLDNCAFQKVFEDGFLLVETNFDDVRRRVRA